MDKVAEMQDSAATNGTVEAINVVEKTAEISSESGENYIGIRNQVQLEAEVEELGGTVAELNSVIEELQNEKAAHEQQLEECRQNITNYDAQVRQLNEELLQALRENTRYRQAFAAAQQRSQAAQ